MNNKANKTILKNIKKLLKRIKNFATIVILYISLAGLYTFTAFILEESQQQIIWGTWPAKDAKNWELVLDGCDLLKDINRSLKILNWSVGYIQPLALLSYHCYWKSTDYYIKSLEALIISKEPQLFNNRIVNLKFTPQRVIKDSEIKLIKDNVIIYVDKIPDTYPLFISHVGTVKGNKLFIDLRKK